MAKDYRCADPEHAFSLCIEASWFETAQERLLTMRDGPSPVLIIAKRCASKDEATSQATPWIKLAGCRPSNEGDHKGRPYEIDMA